MRAAAGLQVDAGDTQQADTAGTARWRDAHGLDQFRLGVELGIGDPDRFRLHHARDQRIGLDFDVGRVQ